jgi:hypothetical protein
MIRRILLLKFVSWVVLSPVLALAPTLRFSGVPHPSYPLRTCRLGLHVGAQDGVDAGLVAASGLLESFDNVMVNPDGQAVFGFHHGELGGLPERFIQPGNIGVISVGIAHPAQAFEVSLALGPRS